jgi:hypothetical protein
LILVQHPIKGVNDFEKNVKEMTDIFTKIFDAIPSERSREN